ncbi:MAG: hypothetical protein APR63_08705 [Desulfuromonas sp. SDB]|nr:MAG: hypothetical protein APR63_08705 [Desulfuromonas sp. SDB]
MQNIKLLVLYLFFHFIITTQNINSNTECPLFFNIIWQPYEFYYDSTFIDKKSPHPMWYNHFIPKLDSLKSINANWIHVRIGAREDLQALAYRSEHPKFWETGLLRFDAAIKWIQDRDMIPFICTYPIGYYNDNITSITSRNDTVIKYFGCDSGYYWYWRVLAERYINLNKFIMTPWGQVCSLYTSYNEYVNLLGIYPLNEPVLYWEICNEPENLEFLGWGGYIDTFRVYNGDTIFFGEHISIDQYARYIKISAKSIRDATNYNQNVKIVGPAVSTPLCQRWDTALIFDIENKKYIHLFRDFNAPESFWGYLNDLGVLECFDVISVHGYIDIFNPDKLNRVNIDTLMVELDRLRQILDSLGYGKDGDYKPVWLTEIGWQRNWFNYRINYPYNDNYENFGGFADSVIISRMAKLIEESSKESRDWLEKIFIWSLCDYNYPDHITPITDYSHMYRPCSVYKGNIILHDPIPYSSFIYFRQFTTDN